MLSIKLVSANLVCWPHHVSGIMHTAYILCLNSNSDFALGLIEGKYAWVFEVIEDIVDDEMVICLRGSSHTHMPISFLWDDEASERESYGLLLSNSVCGKELQNPVI